MIRTDSRRVHIPGIVIELWIGIMAFAIVCELVGIWFVPDRLKFTTGLFLGALLSCACSFHIWYALDKSLGSADEKAAARRVGAGYLVRYVALILLVVILYFTGIGSPFAAFLGYMGMKPAAYIQPTIHKAADRIFRRR